jgi:hypothetical protein
MQNFNSVKEIDDVIRQLQEQRTALVVSERDRVAAAMKAEEEKFKGIERNHFTAFKWNCDKTYTIGSAEIVEIITPTHHFYIVAVGENDGEVQISECAGPATFDEMYSRNRVSPP